MNDSPWVAAITTLFLWWFSTGIILWRVRVADNGTAQDHINSVIIGLPLLAAGLALLGYWTVKTGWRIYLVRTWRKRHAPP